MSEKPRQADPPERHAKHAAELRQIGAREGWQKRIAREIISGIEKDLVPTLTCYDQNPAVFLATRHAVAKTIQTGG